MPGPALSTSSALQSPFLSHGETGVSGSEKDHGTAESGGDPKGRGDAISMWAGLWPLGIFLQSSGEGNTLTEEPGTQFCPHCWVALGATSLLWASVSSRILQMIPKTPSSSVAINLSFIHSPTFCLIHSSNKHTMKSSNGQVPARRSSSVRGWEDNTISTRQAGRLGLQNSEEAPELGRRVRKASWSWW